MGTRAGGRRDLENGGPAIEIVNTHGWPIERLAPYMTGILEQMGRLADRFPGDVTMGALFGEYLQGRRTLWLVIEGGTLLSIAMTTIRTVDATGQRIAKLHDLAGEGVQRYAAQLCAALEAWADENDCPVMEIEGRRGWEPLLKQFDYRPYAVLYRKAQS